jgi:hypothetical protein
VKTKYYLQIPFLAIFLSQLHILCYTFCVIGIICYICCRNQILNTMMNPFIVKAYSSKELFCDREKELDTLIRNFENDTDTTIISQRRMGKTGLIYRLFDEIKARSLDMLPVYVDIYASRSMADFIKSTAEAVLRAFPEESSFGKRFMTFVKSLRPQISFDALTGEVQLQIAYQSLQEKEHTLKELFEYLDRQGVRILLAYDEFQQIREYPEQNIEALLRTYMQTLKNIHFIFCGSKKHLMADIFTNAKKPFYSSTAFMTLDRIAIDSYHPFIKRLFTEGGRTITDDAIDYILEWTRRHTYYTQSLCHTIFADGAANVKIEDAKAACLEILQQNEMLYLQYRQMLTAAQWNYMIAIAKEGRVMQITAKDFLSRYRIGMPSASKRLVKSLCDKELLTDFITKEGTCYAVYDVFMSRWLERKF